MKNKKGNGLKTRIWWNQSESKATNCQAGGDAELMNDITQTTHGQYKGRKPGG